MILSYQKISKNEVFIETGTYLGDMVWAMKDVFKQIYSIKLSDDLYKKAVKKFKIMRLY